MTFGGKSGIWEQIGGTAQQDADRLVGVALDAGINFFDTADVYAEGESERILGQGARRPAQGRRAGEQGSVAHGTGPERCGAFARAHHGAIDGTLRRLGTDWIDLYQIHGYDALTPLDETLRALDDLVRAGKVRNIGCSNLAAWHIAKANGLAAAHGWSRFESLQAYYSIAGRDLERELVPVLADQQMGLMVWSPLAGGFLSGKYSREQDGPAGSRRKTFDFPPVNRDRAFDCIDAMRAIGAAHGVSVARVALAWLLAQKARHDDHRRRQARRAAARQRRGDDGQAQRGRPRDAGSSQRAAERVSGVDDRAAGGGREPAGGRSPR